MPDYSHNPPSNQIPIGERVKAWPGIIKKSDFVGQIDLSENDLRSRELVDTVREGFRSRSTTTETHSTRVVFAVNCVYYAKDGGFWRYFCKMLGYVDTLPRQQEF